MFDKKLVSEGELTVMENIYSMQMTIEKHFENLAQHYPAVKELQSLWVLFKKRIEEDLIQSRGAFVHYSLHDGSHSRAIIQAIERFLGEGRICRLSATDTFMLLVCAYVHDCGMAQTFNKIYDVLGSEKFNDFLKNSWEKLGKLDEDEKWAVNNLLCYLEEGKNRIPLNDIYFSILLVVQLYLRPNHWNETAEIRKKYEGIFLGQIKNRFIYGHEGIVEICMCHGQSMDEVLRLPMWADGIVGDDYHPRFVAAMLRLGDLLDLDNGRFPTWFVSEIARKRSVIPKLSVLHFKKHEAISHLLITPEKIEVMAHCYSRPVETEEGENEQKREVDREKALKECYEVASLVSEWTTWLSEECQHLILHWYEIVQPHFGAPPSNLKVSIFVDGREYMAENRALQMKMSQERVMNLLEGTNIYQDSYVGIREMIQNAIDASLLQLWSDLLQNRYKSYGLSKAEVCKDCSLMIFMNKKKATIFENYDITVEVIKDKLRGKVFIVVKDRGIGITKEEVKYIADIGSSKVENKRFRELINTMPAWMKPSGVFGIGLQSVFQLTDCLEFYTRQHNEPECMISLYSYGKNLGKIEAREMPENKHGLYNDNVIPGTNVKIAIEPEKLLGSRENGKSRLKYYDPEFDTKDELDVIFAEICRACEEKIKENPIDYFNVFYQPMIIEEDGQVIPTQKIKCWRYSFINPDDSKKNRVKNEKTLQDFQNISEDGFSFNRNEAFFWDKNTSRCYFLTVRPCKIIKGKEKMEVSLPEKIPSLYNISYKFNNISDAGTIYEHGSSLDRLRAGLLNMKVLIFDDQPTKYMNIDRDWLREGAISEEELLAVRSEILQRWCEYFCSMEKQRKDSHANNVDIKKKINHLVGGEGKFFSLILLFYLNVPRNNFYNFIKPYLHYINSINCYLENENIPIKELWNPQKVFRATVPLEENEEKENVIHSKESEMLLQNISRLPHRLVHIEKIYKSGDALLYYFHLKNSEEVMAIEMDDEVRLRDYMKVFDEDLYYGSSVRFDSAIKKVFKPDKLYQNILIPCFPQTFWKGRNWENDLDFCINWYILSPFDQQTLNAFRKKINEKERDIDFLVESVMNSEQLEKCVLYIIKKRELKEQNEEKQMQDIKNTYKNFVKNFFTALYENKEMLLKQFKK